MGLFKKEDCVLCGGKTGLLDKKCLDGKVCKSCRNKLSVYFDELKNSDKSLLEAQLRMRDFQASEARYGNYSKIFGEYGVILIDEENRRFIPFPDPGGSLFSNKRAVKSLDDVIDRGVDLIDFDQVKDIELNITETTREETRTVDDREVSYDPPRILYMEDFTIHMKLDHPFLKSIYIRLNDGAVEIHNIGRRLWTDPGRRLAAHLLDLPGLVKEDQEAVFDNESLLHTFMRTPYEMPDYSYGFKCTPRNREEIRKYQYYLAMAREIENIITGKGD